MSKTGAYLERNPDPLETDSVLSPHEGTTIYVTQGGKFKAAIDGKWVILASLSSLKKRIAGRTAPVPAMVVQHPSTVGIPLRVELVEARPSGNISYRDSDGAMRTGLHYGSGLYEHDPAKIEEIAAIAVAINNLVGAYRTVLAGLRPLDYEAAKAALKAAAADKSAPDAEAAS